MSFEIEFEFRFVNETKYEDGSRHVHCAGAVLKNPHRYLKLDPKKLSESNQGIEFRMIGK